MHTSVHRHTKHPLPSPGAPQAGEGPLVPASRWRCRTARRPGASGGECTMREDPSAGCMCACGEQC